MNHYRIRINKIYYNANIGTKEHVWRVFENEKEYLFKHVQINCPSYSERTDEDWNISCDGYMTIDRENSMAIISWSKG